MKTSNKIFLVLVCSLPAVNALAQHNLGLATSDYSALNSLYINPASISGCKEKVAVSLFAVNIGVDNNVGTFSNLSKIDASKDVFNFTGKGNFSALAPALEIRLPGIMVSLNDPLKQSFALTSRIRAINQFNNFSQDLYSTVSDSSHTSSGDFHYKSQNFNWTAHIWSEIALSYALTPFEQGPHKIQAGISIKYLGGIDYLSIKGKNLDIDYKACSDSFFATNSDLEFASDAISANSAYSNGVGSSGIINKFFGAKAGSGFGMDIGVTYTYTVGGEKSGYNKWTSEEGHKLKISAAVTDIGSIKYKEGNNFVVNVAGNGYLTGTGIANHLNTYSDLKDYAHGQGFSVDTGSKTTKVYMPTALILNADYQIYTKFYVNLLYLANLANRQNYGNSYYSQVTLTPRFNFKLIGVALPVTYSTLAKEVKVGLGFRISGLYFGSDDMLALMSNNQHGMAFYFGGYVPIYRKPAKDDHYR